MHANQFFLYHPPSPKGLQPLDKCCSQRTKLADPFLFFFFFPVDFLPVYFLYVLILTWMADVVRCFSVLHRAKGADL